MKLPQSGYWSAFSRPVTLTILLTFLQLSVLAGAQQLTSTPASLHFGKVVSGQADIMSVSLTNNGSSSVTVSSVTNAPPFTVSSPALPLTLAAGQSAQVEITFAPTAVGFTVETIEFASNASNSTLDVQVRGTGVTEWSLTPNPSSLSFGNVQTGSSATLPVVLTNYGTSAITISQEKASGPGFSYNGLNLPLNLAPGESFTFSATFTPQAAGLASGALRVSNPTNTIARIPWTGAGTAAGQLTITPANMSFGNVIDGTSASQPGTLTAGGTSITISSASNSNPEFSLGGLVFPLTLAAGQSVPFTVIFSPQNTGPVSESLSFSSNATALATATLAGTGMPPYSVGLSWDASTSTVVGYNVYRGGQTGGPYAKVFSLDPNTSYTDNSVAAGNSYYYVTTAVDSEGEESAYSNQVQAVIP
jgi:hypothetical protein